MVSPLFRHRLVRLAITLLVLASACVARVCIAADTTPPNAFRPADAGQKYALAVEVVAEHFEPPDRAFVVLTARLLGLSEYSQLSAAFPILRFRGMIAVLS